MTKKTLPKFVYEDRGYIRFIRRARSLSVMMPEQPGTPEFWDHYNRLLKGRDPIPAKRTFETLALSYFESDGYTKLKPRTKSDYRHYIEHIRAIWGDRDPRGIAFGFVGSHRDRKSSSPDYERNERAKKFFLCSPF